MRKCKYRLTLNQEWREGYWHCWREADGVLLVVLEDMRTGQVYDLVLSRIDFKFVEPPRAATQTDTEDDPCT